MFIVGVDIGGTCTDCVVLDQHGSTTIGKALSTPDAFERGVLDSLADAAGALGVTVERLLSRTRLFVHACTVADNVLVTRSGARTGLVTTRGFGDVLTMMRGMVTAGLSDREAAHYSAHTKPEPMVGRSATVEVVERVDAAGEVLVPLDVDAATGQLERLLAGGVESIAVSTLWSIRNPSHEQLVRELLGRLDPKIDVTLSSEIAPFVGEYERTATAVINAYVQPAIRGYLTRLSDLLEQHGLRVPMLMMEAHGGVVSVPEAERTAIRTIESGPAAGVIGSEFLSQYLDCKNLLVTDMGGTTFKVGLVHEGRALRDYAPVLERYRVLTTKVAVQSIGAGGGSIAWVDGETGRLKVGPKGAGADPGPASYGLGGTEPTVSDADLLLGLLGETSFLGGRLPLHRDLAVRALQRRVCEPLGLTLEEGALAVYDLVNARMADLIRTLTVERGTDPRDYVILASGGAAGMHASRYAAEIGISTVVIPTTASVQGAIGLALSDVRVECAETTSLLFPVGVEDVRVVVDRLVAEARRRLRDSGFTDGSATMEVTMDMRYTFQDHELRVPLETARPESIAPEDVERLEQEFTATYASLYGTEAVDHHARKEIVAIRVSGVGGLPKPSLARGTAAVRAGAGPAPVASRDVYFAESRERVPTPVHRLDELDAGDVLRGPAIIESPVTTIVVNPEDRADVDAYGNVWIRVGLR